MAYTAPRPDLDTRSVPEPLFVDRLALALDRVDAAVCVGLDPVLERMPEVITAAHWEPARAIEAFCKGVIDAVAGQVGVVKPQSACFERYGHHGMAALETIIEHAKSAGLLVLLDAKRSDIGLSAAHYAAWATHIGADAITLNGYLGMETIEPYLQANLGVFVLVRTSNPGSDAFQAQPLADGRTIAQLMAHQVAELGREHPGESGLSNVGAVVGATKSAEGSALRKHMPDQVFLVPGYGAQGGTAEDIKPLIRPGATSASTAGIIVNASRSVLYPTANETTPCDCSNAWQEPIAKAACKLAADIRAVIQ